MPPLQRLQELTHLQVLHLSIYMNEVSEAPLPALSAFPAMRVYSARCVDCVFCRQGNLPLVQVGAWCCKYGVVSTGIWAGGLRIP